MCAVIICFWPSSVTLTASSRTVKSPTCACWPGLSSTCSSCLKPSPAKPRKISTIADVDDVAAVAALVAPDEPDERREDVGAGGALPDARAAPELLRDRADDEAAQREADARRPDADAERDNSAADDDSAHATGNRN